MVSRIYKYLLKQGLQAKIIPLTSAVSFCITNAIDYIKIEDFFEINSLDTNFKDAILKIAHQNHNNELGIPFSHTLAYYGIGLNQLFIEKGLSLGLEYFKTNGRKSFLPTNFAKTVINDLKPNAIFTTNSPRMELAFRIIGKSMQIKTFAIDDLIGYFRRLEYISSDVVFVDNEIAKENVKNYSYKGEIIISGNPVYEDIFKLRREAKQINNNNLLIILQTGISNVKTNEVIEFSEQFFKNFFKNIEKLNFFNSFDNVTIRFHPSMKKIKYWKSENFQIDTEENLHQSLLNHSSVFGLTSTAIYEAYLIGCSVYNLSFKNDFFCLPIEYIGNINIFGDFHFDKDNPKPVLNHETQNKQSLEIIYNKLINEVFKN